MYLTIRHDTIYRYSAPLTYSIQQIRMTPPTLPSQYVAGWRIAAPGALDASTDAYGNALHSLVVTRPLTEIALHAHGAIDTQPLDDGRLGLDPGPVPVEHYTCPTRLTEADDAIRELAVPLGAGDGPDAFVALAERIAGTVAYRQGVTAATSTAADALALRHGVCQDHAHLMLACCRAGGVPARYVSGYFDAGDVEHAASHAWVDVWVREIGWVSIDVTHARFAGEAYCRVATGRDYEAAAPVRGMRIGGGEESLDVKVDVQAGGAQ
ncbi:MULTISPECIES: transglutaminase family protein [Burkholderia]|uniref:Transglutaminase-like superfamily protein n=1 Tax=Burkholderia cepacia TaxID=292 RepID=A0AA89CCZ0_BURCE|nr:MULTISPECIES: transglutaminase family protein [Burkholderia]KGB94013.1 transglutaminase-like superfamily protein [Burkholderia cepacia]KWE50976.1 transglutaminase [Burkholderia sp. MSMB2157WGS]